MARLQTALSASIATVVAWLVVWGTAVARAQQDASIGDILLKNHVLTNVTGAGEENLLAQLAHIVHMPTATKLRIIQELQHGHAARFCHELLGSYPRLTKDNLAPWLARSRSFLSAYVKGMWPVYHGNLKVAINQTALSGLPLLRRLLLAQLLTAWLEDWGRQLPAGAEQGVAELVGQLYDIHQAAVVQKGIMEYFHISKSGGTSWNAAAKMNGCVRAQAGGSHVKGFDDECRWIDQAVYKNVTGGRKIMWGRWGRVLRATKFRGCHSRYDHMVAKGFSYTSNEYTLQGGQNDIFDVHTCPQVVNVVTVRDPVRRMESAIRFIMMHAKAAYRKHTDPERPEVGEAAFDAVWCNASAAFWEAMAPPVADNYNVRSFLGERGFHTPLGRLGKDHIAAAKDVLLQFDLVLDLDAGEAQNDRLTYQALGWPAALSRAHALDATKLSSKMNLNYSACHPAPGDVELLRARQAPDVELYRFARVLNLLDELWLDMARAVARQPVAGGLTAEATPQEIKCGMLWRGANRSALVHAVGHVSSGNGSTVNVDALVNATLAGYQGDAVDPEGALDPRDGDADGSSDGSDDDDAEEDGSDDESGEDDFHDGTALMGKEGRATQGSGGRDGDGTETGQTHGPGGGQGGGRVDSLGSSTNGGPGPGTGTSRSGGGGGTGSLLGSLGATLSHWAQAVSHMVGR